jgi:ribonuclease-3
MARELELGPHLRMGPGENRTGGHQRSGPLADALEALFGAILLDGGIAAAQSAIEGAYARRLTELPAEAELVDAKTALQEWLQARGMAPPGYRLLETGGTDHARTFQCECAVPGLGIATTGTGRSRRRAEQAAAARALEQVGDGA